MNVHTLLDPGPAGLLILVTDSPGRPMYGHLCPHRAERFAMKHECPESFFEEYASKYPMLLTIDHVAEITHIAKPTLYDYSSRGEFDSIRLKVRGRLFFFRDRLLEWICNGGQLI